MSRALNEAFNTPVRLGSETASASIRLTTNSLNSKKKKRGGGGVDERLVILHLNRPGMESKQIHHSYQDKR